MDKPVIFALRGYPWLMHRLTYRRRISARLQVRGYKEEGTITAPLDMTVLNESDPFHLVRDAIDRLPQLEDRGTYLKAETKARLIEQQACICRHGRDLALLADGKWPGGALGRAT